MKGLLKIDVKIADFLKRALNYYIKKRTYVKPSPTEDEIWKNLPFKNNELVYPLDDGLNIILFDDSVLCKLIYFGFEKNEIDFVCSFLKEGDVFVDIGANIGLFSLYASKKVGKKGKVYAFEPTPKTYERLNKNLKLNNCENVIAENFALSDKKGTLCFNTSITGYDAWNSFASMKQLEESKTIMVKTNTLDNYIEEINMKNPNLVKIDVEGWEKFVALGANKLMLLENAPILMMEFTETNAFAAGYYCGELYDLIKSYGYEWYSYDSITKTLKPEVKKLHYPWENLVAIKNKTFVLNRIQQIN